MNDAVYEGCIGADRMAVGLGCIPDPIKGDLDEVLRLHAVIAYIMSDAARSLMEVEKYKAEIELYMLQTDVYMAEMRLYEKSLQRLCNP